MRKSSSYLAKKEKKRKRVLSCIVVSEQISMKLNQIGQTSLWLNIKVLTEKQLIHPANLRKEDSHLFIA